ncbi:MAG: hypothetical protein SOI44_05340 [Lactimicrobium sp.]|uniref:hypothetical protein n=1 Tax=Lactimicrobium sp. TaxID=2563780 RepID=UPI002F35C6B3
MKKIPFIAICTCLALLTGCGGNKTDIAKPTTAVSPTPTATPTPSPTELTYVQKMEMLEIINSDLNQTYGTKAQVYADMTATTFTLSGSTATAKGTYKYPTTATEANESFTYTFNILDDGDVEKKDADVTASTPTPTASSSSASTTGKKADYTPTEKFDFTCNSSITVYGKMEGSGTYRADVVDSDGKIVANVFNESSPFDTTKTVDLPAGSYSLWILLDNAGNWDLNYTVS